MHLAVCVVATLLSSSAFAVFADEAWTIDYHHPLLGAPREHNTFFHNPSPDSRASLLYTLSDSGLLGAVNPKDGALVWRHLILPDATPTNASFLRPVPGQDLVISAAGQNVAAWAAADGRLAWDQHLLASVEDMEVLELADGRETASAKDAIVLTAGPHPAVSRLDGMSGAIKWTHPLDAADIPYQVTASDTDVFGIVLHRTMLGSIKIRVVTLDPVTGRKTDEHTLASDSELTSPDSIISVGANSASPIIAWADSAYTVLKVNIVGTKTVASFDIDRHDGPPVTSVRIHAPYHINSRAHFLVHLETDTVHWAEVFHVDLEKNRIDKAFALPKMDGRGAFATSTSDANVYFTRLTNNQVLTVSSVSHGILGRWSLSDFGVTAREQPEPVFAVSEVSVKGDSVSALRSAVYLSTGDWVLVREGSSVWHRPEALATTVAATFAVSAEVQALAEELEAEASSNPLRAYLRRVRRHIGEWRKVPQVLAELPRRIQDGLFGTTAEARSDVDVFGFHQIIVCATSGGRVIALDAGNPDKILWSKKIAVLPPEESWLPTLKSFANGVLTVASGLDGKEVSLNVSTGDDVDSPAAQDLPTSSTGSVRYTLRNGELEATKAGSAADLWRFVPSNGERVLSLIPRPFNDPVASIGKVLGDRRVLYKYLSPNLALLATVNEGLSSASFYVLDTVSGSTLYANTHADVDLSAPIPSIMSENWFAYSYTSTSTSTDDMPKGHQLVVGEMFESLVPDDRGPLGGRSNSSSLDALPQPFVLARSYQIPEPVTTLAVSRTKQGITSRQILAVLADSHSIVGIPYGVVDPRRPLGRDATKDEQAEGLVRYAPTLEFDPKWLLNHQREVFGIREVILAPALLESTSLTFAYGHDIFGTRLSPSFSFDILGKDFNKFQMLATVAALAVGTFAAAPLVARKQVDARWQFA